MKQAIKSIKDQKVNVKESIRTATKLYDSGDYQTSLRHTNLILRKYPYNIDALSLQFDNFIRLKNWQLALSTVDKLIKINPTGKNTVNKGCCYIILGQFQKALDCFVSVEHKEKNNLLLLINKGIALRNLYRYPEAIECFSYIKEVAKEYPYAAMHLGIVYHELNQFDNAIEEYKHGLTLDPKNGDIFWNLSLSLLAKGDYENGWAAHEWRFYQTQQQMFTQVSHNIPRWDLTTYTPGMKLLIEPEQGLGDLIQFSRFIKPLADKGVYIIFAANKEYYHLANQIDGVNEVFLTGMGIQPVADYYCYICSLPAALRTTLENLPKPLTSFRAPDDRKELWNKKIKSDKPVVGLIWSGNPNYVFDYRRSIPLEKLIPVLPKNIDYICINKQISSNDLEMCRTNGIRFVGDEINDWFDTEAIIENVDLVVGVSTSVPTLSATMGKETWIMLSYSADWRWLIGRSDSPWFSDIKLFRQQTPGQNWDDVLQNISNELKEKFGVN